MRAAATAAAVALLGSAAASSLYEPSRPDSKVARNVLEGKSEGYCSPSGPIESTHCAYETVESVNRELYPALHALVAYPFFRHYKVDLYRECPFWYENGFCMNRACGVEAADEIPDKWRAQALSAVRVSSTDDDGGSSCYFREQDFCYIEDDSTQDGQYVDLLLNPERFTGYAGDSAHHVWQAIYEENCFGLSEAAVEAHRTGAAGGGGGVSQLAAAVVGAAGSSAAMANGDAAGWGFSKLSEGWGTEMVRAAGADVDMCEEKKVYYRVISGLHASISIHICADYLDQTTGEWAPNLQCFISRLATHPERLSNVYFNAVLLLRAVARAAPYMRAYDIGVGALPAAAGATAECDTLAAGQTDDDARARDALERVLAIAESEPASRGFDEHEFFRGEDALVLKEQFKSHFRNVSRIMDCVGCDKCRLWGKLQVSGVGTALKILFELDEKALDPRVNPNLLQRSEVVALFNTLHRFSESLASVEDFRRIYAQTQADEAAAAEERERAHAAHAAELARRAGLAPTLLAAALSALEALRRGCRGCVDVCVRQLESGPLAGLVDTVRRLAAQVVGKTEL